MNVAVPRTDMALPLQLTAQSPYLAALRRLPLLDRLLPAPQWVVTPTPSGSAAVRQRVLPRRPSAPRFGPDGWYPAE